MMNPKKLCLCSLFVILYTAGAYIRIPLPFIPLSFLGQICIVCGMILGPKSSAITTTVYLIMGIIGLPVFVTSAGLSFFIEPTAGYVLSFIPASFITGLLFKRCKKDSFKSIYLSSLPGMLLIEVIGSVYVYFITTYYLKTEINILLFTLLGFLFTTVKDMLVNIPFCYFVKRFNPIISKI